MAEGRFVFAIALVVNLVNSLGTECLKPVVVPYGRWIGADVNTIATFNTVQGLCLMVSNLWMPWLSDRRGPEDIIVLSLGGCAAAYLLQGLSWRMDRLAVHAFMAARGVNGFFSGSTPVLRAYVTDMSMPDELLLTKRLTYLCVSNQVVPLALAPVAGVIAALGMDVPFHVCSCISFFGLLVALFGFARTRAAPRPEAQASSFNTLCQLRSHSRAPFFSELDLVRDESGNCQSRIELPRVRGEGGAAGGDACAAGEARPLAVTCTDQVLVLIFFAYFFINVAYYGAALILPYKFCEPSFGLVASSDAERSEEAEDAVALAIGISIIPQSVCNFVCSLFLFLPATQRFGELATVGFVGVVWSATYWNFGWLPTQVWHASLLSGVMGACIGFVVPVLAPLLAKHASKRYPGQIATAIAFPTFGMSLAMAFGQNIIALVKYRFGLAAAWNACAFFCFIASAMVLRAITLVSPEQASWRRTTVLAQNLQAEHQGAQRT